MHRQGWRRRPSRTSALSVPTTSRTYWATVLHRELAERGSRASYDSVRRIVTRRLSHEVIRKWEDSKPEEQARVTALRCVGVEVGEAVNLVEELAAMIRKRSARLLPDWLWLAGATVAHAWSRSRTAASTAPSAPLPYAASGT
jgi:hypothetical protein